MEIGDQFGLASWQLGQRMYTREQIEAQLQRELDAREELRAREALRKYDESKDGGPEQKLWVEMDQEAYTLLEQARQEYATGEDRLDNFKTIARLLGMEPRQVLRVYFLKHVLSFVRGGTIREPMRGRRIDMMNYIRLDELMEAGEG